MENIDVTETKYVPTDPKDSQLVPENEVTSETWYLWFSVLTGLCLFFFGGTTIVWFSPALIKLKSNDTSENPIGRPITTFETSQLVGVIGIVSLIGSITLPKVADIVGRKIMLLLNGFIMLFSIIGVAFSRSVTIIILFETFVGIGFSAVSVIMPIYLTEICENHNRAKFGCLMSVFLPVGQLFTFTIGTVFSYRTFTLLTAAPLIPFVILFWLAPESPVYYITKGKQIECKMVLKKLRNNKTEEQLQKDFDRIQESVKVTLKTKQNSLGKLFTLKECRTGLILGFIPIFIQFFSGVPIVMTLLAPIFNESGSSFSGNTISIIVGFVKLLIFTISFILVEKTGRKPLLIISSIGAGVTVALLGFYFYLKAVNSPLLSQLHWVPLVFVLLYISMYGIGLGAIPMSMISELFLHDVRSTATALTTTVANGLLAVYISSFPYLVEIIGTHCCMWIFSGTCLLGALLIYLVIPETKGKSVLEIQNILQHY